MYETLKNWNIQRPSGYLFMSAITRHGCVCVCVCVFDGVKRGPVNGHLAHNAPVQHQSAT